MRGPVLDRIKNSISARRTQHAAQQLHLCLGQLMVPGISGVFTNNRHTKGQHPHK